jgi:hypothetical protein
MNIYNSLFSQSAMLNEQVARQVFEIIPEQGPLVVLINCDGNCWPSDSDRFEKLNLSADWMENFRSKIDDGVEPVISQIENYSIVGSQLDTGNAKCGYVLMALDGTGPESLISKMELVEMILGQFSLIARMIERCNSLYQTQAKLFSPVYNN